MATYVILIMVLAVLIFLFWFFREIILQKKKTKNIQNWTNFNSQLIDWAKEIQDEKIKFDFIKSELENSINKKNFRRNFNSEIEKEKIILKWGRYIPSLLKESRNKKLNKIIGEF